MPIGVSKEEGNVQEVSAAISLTATLTAAAAAADDDDVHFYSAWYL